jgi:hypothetical protein
LKRDDPRRMKRDRVGVINAWRVRCILPLLLGLCAASLGGPRTTANSSQTNSDQTARPLGDHYLLLVNTAIAFMMDEAKLRQFDQSPYDGLAVAFQHAYDTSPVPSVAAMNAETTEWKKFTRKDIWPWVYVNRMIGKNPVENNAHADTPYFESIKGADLDDAQGAKTGLITLWGNSLSAARISGVPGVIFDLEFYNNYKSYDIGELARQASKTPADVAASLQKLGSQMADVAADKDPGATIWFLFTGFTHAAYKTYSGVPYYPSPTYVAMGFLDEIAQKKLNVKVLAGGEGSLGYCHDTLADFRSSVDDRAGQFKPVLDKYGSTLQMAGTMTLWSDRTANNVCKTATANSIEDLEPYLEFMMRSYRYDWIWGSADGGYVAFSPASAPRFDAVIRQAEAHAWSRSFENNPK